MKQINHAREVVVKSKCGSWEEGIFRSPAVPTRTHSLKSNQIIKDFIFCLHRKSLSLPTLKKVFMMTSFKAFNLYFMLLLIAVFDSGDIYICTNDLSFSPWHVFEHIHTVWKVQHCQHFAARARLCSLRFGVDIWKGAGLPRAAFICAVLEESFIFISNKLLRRNYQLTLSHNAAAFRWWSISWQARSSLLRSMSSFLSLCLLFDTSKGLFLTSCHGAGHPSCRVRAVQEERSWWPGHRYPALGHWLPAGSRRSAGLKPWQKFCPPQLATSQKTHWSWAICYFSHRLVNLQEKKVEIAN